MNRGRMGSWKRDDGSYCSIMNVYLSFDELGAIFYFVH
ncbi:hypothetical protein M2372_000836 [Chryseobacterium sp. BIGb0232]|nr:hypothetical protein [Chryseobacterium sp. BIGb0232]